MPTDGPPCVRPGTVERAYQLARSGECAGVGEIRKRLRAERYDDAPMQLHGVGLRTELMRLCMKSRGNHRKP